MARTPNMQTFPITDFTILDDVGRDALDMATAKTEA